ncbi:MAG TPA: hypothetical protein VF017_04840 [Thermoanaerobaculia bacterium]|nr:hypothetical protein [Thermoanaerobaculia bacterium]
MTSRARGLAWALALLVAVGMPPAVSVGQGSDLAPPAPEGVQYPILFVTQVPIPGDFATVGSVFANHMASMQQVGRGGDLWIRYPNGTQRNLTQEAGYGMTGFQGAAAISVRDPAVHWDGTKAVFSMVVGAPTQQYQVGTWTWQLYEVTGLAQGQTAHVTKVPNQPANANNVSPIYGTDDRILFTSDRPRNGAPHLYPQLDEYESTATTTGLWSLQPATGDLRLLNHAPSGAFTPILDSFGRVVFTRWDHLQRDQQADTDVLAGNTYGTFNYADESAGALALANRDEVFPEPRPVRTDLLAGTNLFGHRINHFFPWQINEDGTEEETLNHIGRHELHSYFEQSLTDDPNLDEFIADVSGRVNPNDILNFLHLREDPLVPGRYVGIEAPEFATHASGQVIALDAPPSLRPDLAILDYVTHPATATVVPDGQTPPANHSGHYRDPLPLSDGALLAAHTFETRAAGNLGTRANPIPRYRFRLRYLTTAANGYLTAGATFTSGINETVSWWDPDVLVSYSGELWEWDAVEVRPRTRPARRRAVLAASEVAVFADEGVAATALARDLRRRDLALMVVRDTTTRDELDRQQPFNLRVPGGTAQTLGAGGKIYDLGHLQIYQGDQIRGMYGPDTPGPGRRVLAQALHDPAALAANPPNAAGPPGSVAIAADGSVAAFVPAHRALAWQTTEPDGTPVVRERYWITFQPGEIRTCDGCHGVNNVNQAGGPPAAHSPEALRQALQLWEAQTGHLFSDGFETGDLAAWTVVQ